MEKIQIKTVAKFMGMKDCQCQITDWNFIMMVVSRIESIIGGGIEISESVNISWSYSPKKTGTFLGGADGNGAETVKRTPFEPVFGKFHQISCYYDDKMKLECKKNEIASSKIEAVSLACFRWIKWYYRNIGRKINIKSNLKK